MGAICGIDWASEWHDVHIADRSGSVLHIERFSHDEQGISALTDLLLADQVGLCAIERPDGLLVGRLLEAGVQVLAIHSNQIKAARDRFRAGAGKDDCFDAMVLCELARTDRHRFPALAPCGDETLALRALVRTREDLVRARVALANQLRGQLETFWPGAAWIFSGVDSPIALAFLARYPSPEDARQLGENQSGKRSTASFRWACDKRLRAHVAVLANSTRHWHPWARDVYRRARERGCDHPHAIRVLGRAWSYVLWSCWQNRTPYDPAQHGALQRVLAGGG